MVNILKIVAYFLLTITGCSIVAQSPTNIPVKCSNINSDYLLNSKNRVKTISRFEVSKKDRSDKMFQSKEWLNPMGCTIKKIYYSPENSRQGNYSMIISDFNSKGYRTTLEEYDYNKDSVPVLIFSENVIFDSTFRLLEKKTIRYISKNHIKHFTESYKYDEPRFRLVITQQANENNAFPKTVTIYKYTSPSSSTPFETEIFKYTAAENYTKTFTQKDRFDEQIKSYNGVIIFHRKTIYKKSQGGYNSNITVMNMLTGKKISETIYYSGNSYTKIDYDKHGNKIDEYHEQLPIADIEVSMLDLSGITSSASQSPVKSDTMQLKNGNKKVVVYHRDRSNNKEQKISYISEYNNKMLLIKQDIETRETFTEYKYEYYK